MKADQLQSGSDPARFQVIAAWKDNLVRVIQRIQCNAGADPMALLFFSITECSSMRVTYVQRKAPTGKAYASWARFVVPVVN